MADNRKRTPIVNVRLKSRIPRGCHVRRALFGCPEAVRAYDGNDTSDLSSFSEDVDVDKILADTHKKYLELFERDAKRKPLFNVEPAKNVAFRRSIITRAIAASLPTSTPYPGHKAALSQESALNLSPIETVENPHPENDENQHRQENQNGIIQEIIRKSVEKKKQNEKSDKYTTTINDINKDLSNKSVQTTLNESKNLKDHSKNGYRSVFTQTIRKEKAVNNDCNIDCESNCSDISLYKEDVFERFARALREEQLRQDRLDDREVSPPLLLPLSGVPSIDSSTSSESVHKDLRAQSVYNLRNDNEGLYRIVSEYIKTCNVESNTDAASEKENYQDLQNRARSTSKKVKKSDLKSVQNNSTLTKDDQQKEKEVRIGLKSSSARKSEPKTKRKMCDQETNTSDLEVYSPRRNNKEPLMVEFDDDELQNDNLDEETLKNVNRDSVILREALPQTPDERLPTSVNDRRNSRKNMSVAESHQNESHIQLGQSHILINDDEHLKQSETIENPSLSKPVTKKKPIPITHSRRICTRKSILNANNIEYNHYSEENEVRFTQKSPLQKKSQGTQATYSETDSETDNPDYLSRKRSSQNKPKGKSRQNHNTEADYSNSDDEYNENHQKDKDKQYLILKINSIPKKNDVKSTDFSRKANINEESFQNVKNKNNSTLKKSVPQIISPPVTNHKGQLSSSDSYETSSPERDLANSVFENLTCEEKPLSRRKKSINEVLTSLHRNIENHSNIENNSVMEKSRLSAPKSQPSKTINEQPQNLVPAEKNSQKKTIQTRSRSRQNKSKEAFTEDHLGQSCVPNASEGDLHEKECSDRLIVKDSTPPRRSRLARNSCPKKSSLGNRSEAVSNEDHLDEVHRVTLDAGDSVDRGKDISALRETPYKESHISDLPNNNSRKKLFSETSTSVNRHILPSVNTHNEQIVNRDNKGLQNERDKGDMLWENDIDASQAVDVQDESSQNMRNRKTSFQNISKKKPKKSNSKVFGPLKSKRRRKTYIRKSSMVHTVSNDIPEAPDMVESSSQGCNHTEAKGSETVTDVLQEAYPTDFNRNDVNNQTSLPKIVAEVLSPGLLKKKRPRGRPPKAKSDKSENNPGKIAKDQSGHLNNQTTEKIIEDEEILMNSRQKDHLSEHTKRSLVEINENLSKRSNNLDIRSENDCAPGKKTKAGRRKSYIKKRPSLKKSSHQENKREEPSEGKNEADQIDACEKVVSSTTNETTANDGGLRRTTRKRHQTQNNFEIYQAMVMQSTKSVDKDKRKVPASPKKPRVTKKATSRSTEKKNTLSKNKQTKSRAKKMSVVSEEEHSPENMPVVETPFETEIPRTNLEVNNAPSKESGDLTKKQKNKIVILDNHLIQQRLEAEAPSISERIGVVSSTQINDSIHHDIQADFNTDISMVNGPRDAEISPNSPTTTLFSPLCETKRIPNQNVIHSSDRSFKFLKINNVLSTGLDHLKNQRVKVVASPSKLEHICKENVVVCSQKLPDQVVCLKSYGQRFITIPYNGELYKFNWVCDSPKWKKKCENMHLAELVKNQVEGNSSGLIEIAPGATKSRQWTAKHTLHLIVMEGEAEVGIRNKSYIVKKEGAFSIPKGNEYYIRNLSQTNPLRLYFVKCLPNTS